MIVTDDVQYNELHLRDRSKFSLLLEPLNETKETGSNMHVLLTTFPKLVSWRFAGRKTTERPYDSATTVC